MLSAEASDQVVRDVAVNGTHVGSHLEAPLLPEVDVALELAWFAKQTMVDQVDHLQCLGEAPASPQAPGDKYDEPGEASAGPQNPDEEDGEDEEDPLSFPHLPQLRYRGHGQAATNALFT